MDGVGKIYKHSVMFAKHPANSLCTFAKRWFVGLAVVMLQSFGGQWRRNVNIAVVIYSWEQLLKKREPAYRRAPDERAASDDKCCLFSTELFLNLMLENYAQFVLKTV